MITPVLFVLCGLALAGGLLVGMLAARPQLLSTRKPQRSVRRWWPAAPWLRRGLLTVPAGAGVGWATGWPVAGLAAAAGILGLPRVLAPVRSRHELALVTALSTWTRRVADLASSGAGGLEHALVRSARTAPEPLTTPVTHLAAAIPTRGLQPALHAFAAECADSAVDETVLTILVRLRAGGRGLAELLRSHSAALAAQAAARQDVEADRAKPRTTVRLLVGITATLVLALAVFAGDYLAPLGTPIGQAVLAVVAGVFAVCAWWMHHLSQPQRRPRYLGAPVGGGSS